MFWRQIYEVAWIDVFFSTFPPILGQVENKLDSRFLSSFHQYLTLCVFGYRFKLKLCSLR